MHERSCLLLTVLALFLSLWLILGFWQLSVTNRWLLSLLSVTTAGIVLWRQWHHRQSGFSALSQFGAEHLPPENFQGSVLLVTGNAAAWFESGHIFRESQSGWYLRVDTPEQLPVLAELLAALRPALLPQVAVMSGLLPGNIPQRKPSGSG